jgi:hypothetical protein
MQYLVEPSHKETTPASDAAAMMSKCTPPSSTVHAWKLTTVSTGFPACRQHPEARGGSKPWTRSMISRVPSSIEKAAIRRLVSGTHRMVDHSMRHLRGGDTTTGFSGFHHDHPVFCKSRRRWAFDPDGREMWRLTLQTLG